MENMTEEFYVEVAKDLNEKDEAFEIYTTFTFARDERGFETPEFETIMVEAMYNTKYVAIDDVFDSIIESNKEHIHRMNRIDNDIEGVREVIGKIGQSNNDRLLHISESIGNRLRSLETRVYCICAVASAAIPLAIKFLL